MTESMEIGWQAQRSKRFNQPDQFIRESFTAIPMSVIKESAQNSIDASINSRSINRSEETLIDAPPPPYFNKEKRFDYFKRTAFTLKEWKKIKELCERLGKEFLCSPFSERAIDYLELLNVKKYKVFIIDKQCFQNASEMIWHCFKEILH